MPQATPVKPNLKRANTRGSREAPTPSPPDLGVAAVNASWFIEFEKHKATVLGDPEFERVANSDALTIKDGGSIVPFEIETYKTAMKQSGKYTCGANFWWIVHEYNTSSSVPIIKSHVVDLSNQKYTDRDDFKDLKLTIAVDSLDENPMSMLGALKCVSPIEDYHAPIVALSGEMGRADFGPTRKDKWKKLFLGAHFTFKLLPLLADKEFQSLQERSDMAIDYAAMTFTPVQ